MSNYIKLSDRISWFDDSRKIKLSFNKSDNIITIEGLDYEMKYLDQIKGNKGGNSNIFLLVNPDDPTDQEDQMVIKICNLPLEYSSYLYQRRFQREEIALRKAKKARKRNIIEFYENGILELHDLRFPFYTMERADWDISKFLRENVIDNDQKLLICINILKGFKELHELHIYHRDIKHDNIFVIGRECKIGDLGLVAFKDNDLKFTELEIGDRIGAFGWESPETMNKFLTEKLDDLNFDCLIDTQSDIFQLGKLFWYIFQGNLPVGQITIDDFLIGDQQIFNIIFQMLQYSKNDGRRIHSIIELENLLYPLAEERLLI